MTKAYVLKIEDADDKGYWRVSLISAYEMSFDIKIKDYDKTLKDICRVVPHLAKYDFDLSEAVDDAIRTKPSDYGARKIINFIRFNDFINCECSVFEWFGYTNSTINREPEVDEDE